MHWKKKTVIQYLSKEKNQILFKIICAESNQKQKNQENLHQRR